MLPAPFLLGFLVLPQTAEPPVPGETLEFGLVDDAIARGRAWLLERQSADGGFAPLAHAGACPVAVSAMALWSLANTGAEPRVRLEAGARFLLAHRQPDGGIYQPQRGLSVYTSGVALRALRSLPSGGELPELASALPDLDLYVYRARVPESDADALARGLRNLAGAKKARNLLDVASGLPPEERRALEFLARTDPTGLEPIPLRARVPGWKAPSPGLGPFSYEDVLPIVYLPLEADHQIALRAYEALRSAYDLERNPDLTKRYGAGGFQPGTEGLYYYYLLVARTLAVRGVPWIELQTGERRNWARELAKKLLSLQHPAGFWRNSDGQWWEDEPILVTAYALLALDLCREVDEAR